MTTDDRVALGRHARALLGNPAYREAMAQMKAETLAEFEASAPEEAEKRERLYQDLHALKRLENRIRILAKDGEAEELRHISRSIII